MPDAIAIVGAGPAGIAAASVLVANGKRPVLLDEGPVPGGQVWRRFRDEAAVSALLGSEQHTYRRVHRTFEALRPDIDYRPDTLAWTAAPGTLHLASASGLGWAETLPVPRLIVATGATDRLLPVPGWTLPGVFTLGGAQALLKGQGCAAGHRVVFCGSSPLLYLAALQYVRAGAGVAAVLDTTPFRRKVTATPQMLSGLSTLWRGLSYMRALRRYGVPMWHGVRLDRITGIDQVEGVAFSAAGRDHLVEADAVAIGFGLRPEAQLAELAGAEMRYDARFRQWFPRADLDGRCGGGLYAAGDGCAIGGAEAAEVSGALAAYAALADDGRAVPERTVTVLRRRLRRHRRFQRGLARAFAWPASSVATLPDDTPLCRCENISAGELRRAVRAELGPKEVNRGKAISRCGMGRCQGRFCGLAAAELIAAELGLPLEQVGRLRGQGPVKPLSLAMVGPG